VPDSRAFLATCMSFSTLAANLFLSNAAFHLALSTPAWPAHCSKCAGSSVCWLANASSWNFQKALEPPRRNTVSAAIAAGLAFWWNGSGLFFHTTRSLSGPYFSFSWVLVGSTRLQNGHRQSPDTTIVTGPVR